MSKDSLFICQNCQNTQTKWLGQCPQCGSWNSFLQSQISLKKSSKNVKTNLISLEEIPNSDNFKRVKTYLEEFDRVLGGGAVMQSVILLGGSPGIGKSTLILQIASSINSSILYVSGEESSSQIKLRASRLGLKNLKNIDILCLSSLESIKQALEVKEYKLILIDSIQTISSQDIDSAIGSVSQIKYTASELIDYTKTHNVFLILIAHITKEGFIAGPKVLEHMVDTVLYFEEGKDDLRYIISNKNRFGRAGEVGFFLMSEKGLVQISNPQTYFLSEDKNLNIIGEITTLSYEGSRVIPIEIQALVNQNKSGLKAYSDKIDQRRIVKICAIIQNQISLSFIDQDVFVNTGGGIKIEDTAADLAIALSIYSSKTQRQIPSNFAAIGELTLSGDIRSVKQISQRIKAAYKLGYTNIIGPKTSDLIDKTIKYYKVKTIKQAISIINKI